MPLCNRTVIDTSTMTAHRMYFVVSGNAVKIGYCRNIRERFRPAVLAADKPIAVSYVAYGSELAVIDAEREYHKIASLMGFFHAANPHPLSGGDSEWYEARSDLLSFFLYVQRRHGLELYPRQVAMSLDVVDGLINQHVSLMRTAFAPPPGRRYKQIELFRALGLTDEMFNKRNYRNAVFDGPMNAHFYACLCIINKLSDGAVVPPENPNSITQEEYDHLVAAPYMKTWAEDAKNGSYMPQHTTPTAVASSSSSAKRAAVSSHC